MNALICAECLRTARDRDMHAETSLCRACVLKIIDALCNLLETFDEGAHGVVREEAVRELRRHRRLLAPILEARKPAGS